MVLPVYVYGMSVLRKVAPDIPEDFEGLDQLIEDMFETMRASDGIGLAAPQVGKSLRIFVVDTSPIGENHEDPELKDFKRVFINPYILEEWGDPWSYEEGCLSLPNIREEVSRPSELRIEYYDENWEFHDEYFEGLKARVIQHEYDHIEGVLFIDLIHPLRRKMIQGKLRDITKCKVDVPYQTRLVK